MKRFYLLLIFGLPIIIYGQFNYPDLDGNKSPVHNLSQIINTPVINFKAVNDSFNMFPGFPVTGSFTVYAPKTGGIFCNMDQDADDEIVFGCGTKLYALNIDGSAVTGWPISFPANYEISWAPASGDIDGDGDIEIVASAGGSTGGNLYAFEKDGSNVTGFPVTFGKFPLGAALADLNNDGALEIIIGKYDYPGGEMYVFNGDGSAKQGWPYDMGEYPASFAAVGDITGDHIPEIIGESRNSLWAWDTAGNVLPGWPFIMDDTSSTIINSYASPVIADIDQNGDMEITFCSHNPEGYVFVLNHDGSIYPGWPQVMSNWIYAAPMVADINNDSYPEIIAADQAASATPINYLHAYDRFGNDITGFPVGPVFGIYNQPIIANVDADNDWEILTDANIQNGMDGYYYCYDNDGNENPEWPLVITGNSYFQQMMMGDLNHDDTLDIFTSGIDLNTNDVYMQLWKTNIVYQPNMIINPVYQFNNQHTGVHPTYGPSGIIPLKETLQEISVWPIPAKEHLNISYQMAQQGTVQFSIESISGKKQSIKPEIISSEKGTHFKVLNISTLKTGSYILTIKMNARQILTKKFIKI